MTELRSSDFPVLFLAVAVVSDTWSHLHMGMVYFSQVLLSQDHSMILGSSSDTHERIRSPVERERYSSGHIWSSWIWFWLLHFSTILTLCPSALLHQDSPSSSSSWGWRYSLSDSQGSTHSSRRRCLRSGIRKMRSSSQDSSGNRSISWWICEIPICGTISRGTRCLLLHQVDEMILRYSLEVSTRSRIVSLLLVSLLIASPIMVL